MKYESFQIRYADIKLIYSFMHIGDVDGNYLSIECQPLDGMIKLLKKLDEFDNNPYINSQDYNFLIQICNNRNHWAHNAFVEFIYEYSFEKNPKYKKQCNKFIKDCKMVKTAADILEKIRIKYCNNANGK